MKTHLRYLIILSLGLGLFLRCLWPGDMEYKFDEKHMFEITQTARATGEWPSTGMVSGVGIKNPPLSTWVFIVPALIFNITDPVALSFFVRILGFLTLAILAVLILKKVPAEKQPIWAWALAFAAVNPFIVLYERKIWAQSVMPFFGAVAITLWFYRKNRLGAATCGFVLALLGQIHMSGFFWAAALTAYTFYRDRNEKSIYLPWVMGGVLGMVPMLPWLGEMVNQSQPGHYSFAHLYQFRFWRFWFLMAMGLDFKWSVGNDFQSVFFLPLYAVGYLTLYQFCRNWRKYDRTDAAYQLLISAFFVFGLFLTLSGAQIHRHYLIIMSPFLFLWVALSWVPVERRGKKALLIIWILQFLTTAELLHYIHKNGGTKGGDYGVAYSHQSA